MGKKICSDLADFGREAAGKMRTKVLFLVFLFVLSLFCCYTYRIFPVHAQNISEPVKEVPIEGIVAESAKDAAAAKGPAEEKFVGEFYGVPVPEQNYVFIRSVIAIFGNKFGKQPTTPEEIEDVVWEQLLMSFDAFRRNIEVSQEEIDAEILKVLGSEQVMFDWKKDPEAYAKWLKEKTGETPDLFGNQMKHLIQMQKLREAVMAEIAPEVAEEEIHRAFLNEKSSLDVELVKFESEEDAKDFYNKVKAKPQAWEDEKAKRPKDFRRPGGVTCQFLIDFWAIPSDDQLKMVKMKSGEFYGPAPMYKGSGVFKVMGSTAADETKYAELKDRYKEKVEVGKKFEGLKDWLKKLKEEANMKKYPAKEKADAPLEKTGEGGKDE